MNENKPEKKYNVDELKRLWDMKNFEELALAPGGERDNLREARFIIQAKVAQQAYRVAVVMALASIVMTIATIAMVVAEFRRL